MTTTETIQIRPGRDGHYFASSRSQEGVWWFVQVDRRTITCTCPAGRHNEAEANGRSCAHMRAMVAFVKTEDARYARPAAPVNVSALVD